MQVLMRRRSTLRKCKYRIGQKQLSYCKTFNGFKIKIMVPRHTI